MKTPMLFIRADAVCDDATTLHTAVHVLDAQPTLVQRLVHPCLERGLKGWDQLRKLVKRHARAIQELQRARL